LQKEDLVSGISAIASALAATLGYLWNIGFIQLIFSFLAGSFSTYLIQHRLQIESEKRRIAREHGILMRDSIYGPLFKALNQALDWIVNFGDVYNKNPLMDIADTMENPLYLLIGEGLKNEVRRAYDELLKYGDLISMAKRAIYDLALPRLRDAYPNVKTPDPRLTNFFLNEHGMVSEYISFEKAILQRSNPIEMLQKVMDNLENPTIEVIMDQERSTDLKKIGQVYAEIEQLAWKEKRLLDFEKSRNELKDSLWKVISKLKAKIETMV
jgi:hypothetical protein